MGFDKFKAIFDKHYDNNLSAFINEEEDYDDLGPCPFKHDGQEDLDEINHDSYGNEDSTLRRVFYIPEFDIHVMFWGNRSSYQGEEWFGYKEAVKTTKTISVWE